MKTVFLLASLLTASTLTYALPKSITVYQDPNCGCCSGWIEHMRESGFTINAIETVDMSSIKKKLGVPAELASCHTGVVDASGQVIEGHVPAAAIDKLMASSSVKGVSAPGMPLNSPGMGPMDGNLFTVDFAGKPFSQK